MTSAPEKPLSKAEAAEIRLENQYGKYLKASATKTDLADLLRAGRISAEQAGEAEQKAGDDQPPEIIEGLTRLAGWIATVFEISCSKQIIQKWKSHKPPFPDPISADYRYRWSEVAAWVARYKARPANSTYSELQAKLEPEKLKNELEEIEHDRMMRAVDAGKYLKRLDVNRWVAGVGKILNAGLDNRLELRLRVVALERFNLLPATPPLTAEQLAFVVDTFCSLAYEANAAVKEDLRKALCAKP